MDITNPKGAGRKIGSTKDRSHLNTTIDRKNMEWLQKRKSLGFAISATLDQLIEHNRKRTNLLVKRRSGYVIYWHHLLTHTNPYKEGYIGASKTTKYGDRFNGGLAVNYKRCGCFSRAIEEHGEDNIHTTILSDGLTKERADELELLYRPSRNIGWNVAKGGGSIGDLSEETKEKISKTKTGKNHLYYNKIFTPESREKIRLSKIGNKNMVGKKFSEEIKKNMSIAAKKRGMHENTRKARFKKTICVETGVFYNSQIEAQAQTGIDHKHISACCTGKKKTAGGLHWKYYKENINDQDESTDKSLKGK